REPSRTLAARRYSGRWSWENYRDNEVVLLKAVRAAGLTPVGPTLYARYNAPFVPWFLRRNEVLVEVRDHREGE
ncbi:MAG: heme-binding protein, partial [Bdellovibrio bacteriovorus]